MAKTQQVDVTCLWLGLIREMDLYIGRGAINLYKNGANREKCPCFSFKEVGVLQLTFNYPFKRGTPVDRQVELTFNEGKLKINIYALETNGRALIDTVKKHQVSIENEVSGMYMGTIRLLSELDHNKIWNALQNESVKNIRVRYEKVDNSSYEKITEIYFESLFPL